jgi:hypothetical protein
MPTATLIAAVMLPREVASRRPRGGQAPPPTPRNRRDVLFGLGTLTTGAAFPAWPSPAAQTDSSRPKTPPSPRPGPEFESVSFPRYPGFVTLPSGVQIRDLCVYSGDAADPARDETGFRRGFEEEIGRPLLETGGREKYSIRRGSRSDLDGFERRKTRWRRFFLDVLDVTEIEGIPRRIRALALIHATDDRTA